MALFGGSRDINLFRSVNKEIIFKVIDISIDLFKLDINLTTANMYGESNSKFYQEPFRLNCLISFDDPTTKYDEFGYDKTQTARFLFLRDNLKDINLVIEVGDIIHWDNRYWELDSKIENKYVLKRNNETNKNYDDRFGWNITSAFTAHETQFRIPDIENKNYDINRENENYL